MQITVLSATKETGVSKAGKPYPFIELAYKNDEGKVQGKKIMPFGESKPVFEALSAAASGDVFNITLFKNEGTGYWDWTAAKKSTGDTQEEQSAAITTTRSSTPGGKVTGSNYETPEERAKKQVMIIRQSSISNALTYLNGSARSISEVLQVAKEFENFVLNLGQTPTATQEILNMENDIPL